MKHYVTIVATLLLVLAFGINGAIAQDPPAGHMGMMGGGMMSDKVGGGMMCDKMGGSMMHGGMMCGCMKHDGMMDDGMMSEHHIRMILAQLGLDEKQKDQIEVIITRTKKDMIKRKADLQIAKVDLKNILGKDPVDMKAAESKLKEIEAMKTAMMLAHLNAVEEGKSLLTPQQRAKMKEIMQMHMMGGGSCGCMKGGDMMKGDMMKEMHHDHERMMK